MHEQCNAFISHLEIDFFKPNYMFRTATMLSRLLATTFCVVGLLLSGAGPRETALPKRNARLYLGYIATSNFYSLFSRTVIYLKDLSQ